MKAKAIVIGGEKGGTGKTTISVNIALMAAMMGKDTIHIDTDKQGSATKFFNKRNHKGIKPTPSCIQLKGNYLNKEIEDLANRYEIIIIESAGKDSPELRSALACNTVSKFYTPLQPAEFDMDTLEKMDELAYLARSFNPDLEAYLIFNQAPTHSRIKTLEQAIEASKTAENLERIDIAMHLRIPFQYAATYSQSVVEFEMERINSSKKYMPKASMELCALYEHIFKEKFTGEITEYFKNEECEELAGSDE